MKPPFAYYGGKSRLASWIVSLFPEHRVYVEPFCGSAAVLFAKSPASHEVINDVDHDVVNFFRLLRDRPAELERVCALTPYARNEFEGAVLLDDLDPLERARRWWVRSTQGFGQVAAKTGWSISIHQSLNRPRSLAARVGRFSDIAARLAPVFIESVDAVSCVERYGGGSDALLYVDPPYLGSTRTSINGGRRPKGDYSHEFHTDDDHRRLAESLRATPATVLLSGYRSPLYEELYADWQCVERGVAVQFKQNHQQGCNRRTEVIWSNRPLPLRLPFDVVEVPA